MKRFIRTAGLAIAVLWLWHSGSAFAAAEPRVALVIGNSAYEEAPLSNPVNDARLMAESRAPCPLLTLFRSLRCWLLFLVRDG